MVWALPVDSVPETKLHKSLPVVKITLPIKDHPETNCYYSLPVVEKSTTGRHPSSG